LQNVFDGHNVDALIHTLITGAELISWCTFHTHQGQLYCTEVVSKTFLSHFVQSSERMGEPMFITDALREKVNEMLCAVEERAGWLATLDQSPNWWDEPTQRWAAERALHVAVECVVDAANEIIDALVMRDPGGYADILRVIAEEEVVDNAWFEQFLSVISFRERLIRKYRQLTPEEVRDAVAESTPLFAPYVAAIRSYLGIRG
jgi:uncharacterized protein YutE (UPF0331/DUF86 family)